MTDLQRCEVRPGLLVEFSLDPAAVQSATGLPDDSRPPAYIQESHIRTARSVREDGLFVPTWLGTAFDIPGRVDLDVLQEALRGWMLRHETLRSGFRWAGDDMRRFTLDAADVTLRRETIGEVVPFHTRRNSRWLDSVGWYVGGAPVVEIHTAQAPDFDSLLRMVSARLRASRSLARMPLAHVLRLLGSDFRPTCTRPCRSSTPGASRARSAGRS